MAWPSPFSLRVFGESYIAEESLRLDSTAKPMRFKKLNR